MTEGTVRDLGSGRTLGKTDSIERAFLWAILKLQRQGKKIKVVRGRVTHGSPKELQQNVEEMGVRVVYDPNVGPNVMLIIEED